MTFIRSEIEGSVLRITLNRPDKFNSFNREMALELQAVLDRGAADQTVSRHLPDRRREKHFVPDKIFLKRWM